ncbi:MAG: DNA-binding protein [Lactobacillus delbrueckii]|nr:DNA-binding protein [Lactobacillus delbrueckii]
MKIILTEEQQSILIDSLMRIVEGYLNNLQIEDKEKQPYLSRKKAAEFFGIAPTTLDAWVKSGAPVAMVNGSKMYGKESITRWLQDHEVCISGK